MTTVSGIQPRHPGTVSLAVPAAGLIAPGILALTVALLLPLSLQLAGMAQLNRTAYPAVAFAAAGFLYIRRSPWYLGLCIWLFAFAPLIRRMADLQLGFQVSSTILLAPYLACLWAGLSALRYGLAPNQRHAGLFMTALACVAYGFFVAAIQERVASALLDTVKWTIGPLLALYLIAHREQRAAVQRVVCFAFVSAGVVMSVYGLRQYVDPPAWDLEWVANVRMLGMTSIGTPEAYGIRVFGTINSAGSLGGFLFAAVIFALFLPMPIALPCLIAFLPGLALSQYRSVWAGTAIALLCVTVLGPVRTRLQILLGAALAVILVGSLGMAPEIANRLEARFNSMATLEEDESRSARLYQYVRFVEEGRDVLTGAGFGLSGSASLMNRNGTHAIIDGGFLEIYTYLGLVVGSVFMVVLTAIFWRAARVGQAACSQAHLYTSLIIGAAAQLPFTSVHVGEIGLGLWLAIGLALAAAAQPQGRRA